MSACHVAGRGSIPGPGALLGVNTWLSTLLEIDLYRCLSDKRLKAVGSLYFYLVSMPGDRPRNSFF